MSITLVRCPLCGFRFDPAQNQACPTCPLAKGCTAVCCPACGHSTINPRRSALGRLASALLTAPRKQRADVGAAPEARSRLAASAARPLLPLAEVPAGAEVQVVSLRQAGKALELQAYGLAPGRRVRVLQQQPVTVVQADHTELALEHSLADGVMVDRVDEGRIPTAHASPD